MPYGRYLRFYTPETSIMIGRAPRGAPPHQFPPTGVGRRQFKTTLPTSVVGRRCAHRISWEGGRACRIPHPRGSGRAQSALSAEGPDPK